MTTITTKDQEPHRPYIGEPLEAIFAPRSLVLAEQEGVAEHTDTRRIKRRLARGADQILHLTVTAPRRQVKHKMRPPVLDEFTIGPHTIRREKTVDSGQPEVIEVPAWPRDVNGRTVSEVQEEVGRHLAVLANASVPSGNWMMAQTGQQGDLTPSYLRPEPAPDTM